MGKTRSDQNHSDVKVDPNIESGPEVAAGPTAPRCGLSWGDRGLVLTCSSLEDASQAVDLLKKSMTVEIKPLNNHPPTAEAESEEEEGTDD